MSTSHRKNSLVLSQAIQAALNEAANGSPDFTEIRRLAAVLIRGGEMKERLQNLGVLDAPETSTSPGTEAEGATALLNAIGTVMIDYLPSGCY